MKDFDTVPLPDATDLEFKLGGRVLKRRAGVRPEALIPLDRMRPPSADGKDSGSPVGTDIEVVDEVIKNHLDPESIPVYEEIRADEVNPIAVATLTEVMRWLIAETTGRSPSGQPSASGASLVPPGTPSTAASSPPVARVVQLG